MDFQDCDVDVKVAGINCVDLKCGGQNNKTMSCRMSRADIASCNWGKIHMQKYQRAVISRADFKLVDPKIVDFHPKKGPTSGGTYITINGKHLNAGSVIKVYINGTKCEISKVSDTEVVCKTGRLPVGSYELGMSFDDARRRAKSQFEYMDDPQIHSVSAHPTESKPLEGTPKSETEFYVKGKNLNVAQSAKLYAVYDGRKNVSKCYAIEEESMKCKLPRIDVDSDNLNDSSPYQMPFGFEMDGLTINVTQKTNQTIALRPAKHNQPIALQPDEIKSSTGLTTVLVAILVILIVCMFCCWYYFQNRRSRQNAFNSIRLSPLEVKGYLED